MTDTRSTHSIGGVYPLIIKCPGCQKGFKEEDRVNFKLENPNLKNSNWLNIVMTHTNCPPSVIIKGKS